MPKQMEAGFSLSLSISLRIHQNTHPKHGVAQPQYGGQHAEDTIDHVQRDAEHVESQPQGVEFVHVRHPVDGDASGLVQIVVEFWRFQLVQFDQVFVVLK